MAEGIRANVDAMVEPLGIDADVWSHFIDETDLPAFRMALITGDNAILMGHAQQVSKAIYSGQADIALAELLAEDGHKVTKGGDGKLLVETSKGMKSISYAIKFGLVKIKSAF